MYWWWLDWWRSKWWRSNWFRTPTVPPPPEKKLCIEGARPSVQLLARDDHIIPLEGAIPNVQLLARDNHIIPMGASDGHLIQIVGRIDKCE